MRAAKSCYLLFCHSQFPGSQTDSWQVMLHPSTWSHTKDHHWPHTQHMPRSQCLHDHRMSVLLPLIHRAAEFRRSAWCQISAASIQQHRLHLHRWWGRVQWTGVSLAEYLVRFHATHTHAHTPSVCLTSLLTWSYSGLDQVHQEEPLGLLQCSAAVGQVEGRAIAGSIHFTQMTFCGFFQILRLQTSPHHKAHLTKALTHS